MVRPVIHSQKHYVQQSLRSVLASALETTTIISAVDVQNVDSVNEIVTGSIVKAVYVELWLRGSELSPGSYIVALYKNPGGASAFNTTELAALGNAENKKNVLFFSQALINDTDADAIPVMRGWYKIPKSKQRFGLGDRLLLAVFAQGAIDMVACGFEIYKDYS